MPNDSGGPEQSRNAPSGGEPRGPRAAAETDAHAGDYARVLPLYPLPHHLLSRVIHRLTRARLRPWKNGLIKTFIRHFDVDMSEALTPKPDDFADFNSFFTRALRPGARPLVSDAAAIACPVDGVVSEIGHILEGQLMQAKARFFGLTTLLGGSESRSAPFVEGSFATLYLSPRDYHRIHMPLDGRLREMVHIPGRLFAVNPSAAKIVPGLFARNERVVALFDTAWGPMALILVGAIFVGSVETVWGGEVTPPTRSVPRAWSYDAAAADAIVLRRGQEMGRFNMGSTVIMLFPPQTVHWEKHLRPGARVRMGQSLGSVASDRKE